MSPGTFAPQAKAVDKGAAVSDKLFQLKLDAAWTRLAGGELETTMAEGYRAMGELNLSLAREDEAALAEWPDYTVETPEANPRGDS